MDGNTLTTLCDVAKRKCNVTWKDEDTDKRIQEIVENAYESVRHMLGIKSAPDDAFLKPGKARTIFENYCWYDWNNMLDQFQPNYRREILAERHRNEVENASESAE